MFTFCNERKDNEEDNEDGDNDEDRAGTEATEGEDFVVPQNTEVAELNIAPGKLLLYNTNNTNTNTNTNTEVA